MDKANLKKEEPRQYSVGFRYDSDLNLMALKGIGFQKINSHEYYWENAGRKDEFCLLQYCVEGKGALRIGGVQYPIKAGEAFLIEIPSDSCYFLPEDSSGWNILYMEFSKECLPFLRKIHTKTGPVLHFSTDFIPARMEEIFTLAADHQINTYFINTKLAYNFWIDLLTEILTIESRGNVRMNQVKKYIDQNFTNPELSLDLLAVQCDISKFQMCKDFKKQFGISPGKYIRELRMDKASQLMLSRQDVSMKEIALLVGYDNSNYFGKVFKAYTGLTPNQFRKQNARYDQIERLYDSV